MKVREGYYSEQIRNNAFANVHLSKRQLEVLEVIERWQPICNEDIADHLGVHPHQVTPRTLELRKLGLVQFAGTGKSRLSKVEYNYRQGVSLWMITKDLEQPSLF